MTDDFAAYAAIPGVNWSTLQEMTRSPLHYQAILKAERRDTDKMALGRLTHCAVLEPDALPLRYAVWTGGRRVGSEWDAFVDAHAGREVVCEADYATALAIRDAVHANPDAHELLTGGSAEVTLTWTDPETHLHCKGRLDYLKPETLTDLKTTRDAETRIFGVRAARLLYHGQLGFYAMGARASGYEAVAVRIIAVESAPPHDVAVFELDDDALYAGEELARDLLRRVADCQQTGQWPGRYEGVQTLRLPGWAVPDDSDDELVLMGLKARGEK